MQAALKNIAAHFQESLGFPASLAQRLNDMPDMLVQPEPLSASINGRDVVRWDRFGHSFNGREGVIRGWSDVGGYYQSFDLKRPELLSFGEKEEIPYWECDIQQVNAFYASKSDLSAFSSPDAMVEANSQEMITPMTEEKLWENLQHGEIRILQPNSGDFFKQYLWDDRTILANDGGSHHFAAARYLARRLGISVHLSGRLYRHRINPVALETLRHDFDMFVIARENGAFHNAMARCLATYFWVPLPCGFCEQGVAILLPKGEVKSARAAVQLWKAGAFDLGAYLSELVDKQARIDNNKLERTHD